MWGNGTAYAAVAGLTLCARERLEGAQRLGLAAQYQIAHRPAAKIIDPAG